MLCPLCNEGSICHAIVKKNNQIIYICEECDSVWMTSDINEFDVITYQDYMTLRNLPVSWTELTNVYYL